MAGASYKDFTGTFDGQGHTLTVSYGSAESPIVEDNVAPFRNVENGCVIKNLHVAGNIYTSNKYAAGIAGTQYCTISITNCRSSVTIHSYTAGDGTHGGFVGKNVSGTDSAITITSCIFDGKLLTCGTPYIIKWEKAEGYDAADPDTHDLKNPVFTGVTINATMNNVNTSDGKVTFLGTYDPIVWKAENKTILFLGAGNTLYYPQPDLTNVDTPKYPRIKACRSYFQLNGLTAGDPAPSRFVLNFGEENTTGIVDAEANSSLFTLHFQGGTRLMDGNSAGSPPNLDYISTEVK